MKEFRPIQDIRRAEGSSLSPKSLEQIFAALADIYSPIKVVLTKRRLSLFSYLVSQKRIGT